jgi:signal transduction histidine kinase
VIAYAVGWLVAALVGSGVALGIHAQNVHNGLIAAAFTAVGIFVLRRQPDNREARLFVATGVASAVLFFCRQYGLHDGAPLPAATWVTWFGVWPLPLVLVLAGVTIMSFPDGRLPSPRWRPVVAVMIVVAATLAVVSALWPVEYADNELLVAHPLHVGGAGGAEDVWSVAGPAAYLSFQLVWAACVVVRLRRARGDEALQLRWFVYAVAIGAAVMALGFVVFRSPAPGVLSVPLIAVAAGGAILKYRLYDIDVVIDKTLVVAAMAVLVTAVYVIVVVGVGDAIGVTASPNVALSLTATAVIAVAFDPVRRWVQSWVDRAVYGDRPTPYEALARLSTELTHDGDRDDLFSSLASAIADGVGASDITLWVGSVDELVPVVSWPPSATAVDGPVVTFGSLGGDGPVHLRPIVHRGAFRGAVTLTKPRHDALGPSEDRLLCDLAAQAGVVIELQRQAAELRAAAKRIVVAQDGARRRIERDLHDGAQQRLVTLALSLQDVEHRAQDTGVPDVVRGVADARRQLAEALSELREMARGIHPAVLTEGGLEAAVSFLAERCPVPVRVEVDLPRRLRVDVEAAGYFVVSEALTNVAKHSHARLVVVSGWLDESLLTLEVVDDGCGGADRRWGSGLQGLTDRLATVDGSLMVASPRSGGTQLRAEIPCG